MPEVKEIKKTFATEEEREIAQNILIDIEDDECSFTTGRRNDDAVNTLIALHVLGGDIDEYIDDLLTARHASSVERKLVAEHVARIKPYLELWGPAGAEADALDYTL